MSGSGGSKRMICRPPDSRHRVRLELRDPAHRTAACECVRSGQRNPDRLNDTAFTCECLCSDPLPPSRWLSRFDANARGGRSRPRMLHRSHASENLIDSLEVMERGTLLAVAAVSVCLSIETLDCSQSLGQTPR